MTDHTTEPHEVPLKQCSKCKEIKPATSEYFGSDKRRGSGLKAACRTCTRIDSSNHYSANKDRILKRNRDYHAATPDKQSKRARSYYVAHKEQQTEKRRARHIAKRDQENEGNRAWYAANKDRHNERSREWYTANKDRHAKTASIWRTVNGERDRARRRLWAKANPGLLRAKDQRRRSLSQKAEGCHTAADIEAKYEQQSGRCCYCQCEVGSTYHIDHIIPLSRGGTNWPDNIAIACPSCNLSKASKLLYTEWVPSNPLR